jgi:hypothetical protein
MLTQIEWWGGLIFVVGALTYRMVMGALDTKEEGIPWYRLQMHAFYLLPALLLAGYFYPLESTALQYGYLAVLGGSLVLALVTLVQEVTGDAGDADEERAATDGKNRKGGEAEQAQKEAQEDAQEDAEEAPGLMMSVVGVAVLYSPGLVACGLGCAKAWPMVQRLA